MSDRDWEVVIGRLIIYRKGWRWTVLWRSGAGDMYDRYVFTRSGVGDSMATKLCHVPPEGWVCSREAGHEGPCAAYEIAPEFIPRQPCVEALHEMSTVAGILRVQSDPRIIEWGDRLAKACRAFRDHVAPGINELIDSQWEDTD